MKCPYCGNSDDRVLDTRENKEGCLIRRRRECLNCRGRFSTTETLQISYPFIIKKDGRREPFNQEKILRGLQAACQKRPVSLDQLESIVERISNWVLGRNEKEISSRMLGMKLIVELRMLDDVAYVRFASVYRSFRDVQEFVETLEEQDPLNVYRSPSNLPEISEKPMPVNSSTQLEFFSESKLETDSLKGLVIDNLKKGPQERST